jgi:Major Facilitator Superfamily
LTAVSEPPQRGADGVGERADAQPDIGVNTKPHVRTAPLAHATALAVSRTGSILGSILGPMVANFHPDRLPPMLRATYARELVSWFFLPIMLGAIEGGTIAIVVKKSFTGVEGIDESQLNFAVTLLTAAPNFANLSSFLWASFARGRAKVPFIAALQIATSVLVGLIAVAPHSLLGLWLVTILAILGRTCWTGVITLRAAVWRNNYPNASRASIAGRMATVQSIVLAAAGAAVGAAMDWNPASFHYVFPGLAILGIVGNQIYRKVRLRGQRRLARAELAGRAGPAAFTLRPVALSLAFVRSLRGMWTTLEEDRLYRSFMWWMFIFGFGNLMYQAPLAIILSEEFHVSYTEGILINSIIPLAVMPFAIPMWAKLLDRTHIITFRAIHGWSFVLATAGLWVATLTHQVVLFYVAAFVLGIGFAGGILAWNLGHQHFAPAHKDGEYMAVHVTLNGIRGVLAPVCSWWLLGVFKDFGLGSSWVFAICVAVNVIGAMGFVAMARELRRVQA